MASKISQLQDCIVISVPLNILIYCFKYLLYTKYGAWASPVVNVQFVLCIESLLCSLSKNKLIKRGRATSLTPSTREAEGILEASDDLFFCVCLAESRFILCGLKHFQEDCYTDMLTSMCVCFVWEYILSENNL